MSETVATTTETGLQVDRKGWGTLLLYPVILLLILIGLFAWLYTRDLSTTEQVTLGPGELWSMTLEHLYLTVISTVIVLAVGIPLGILLTRGPMRRFSMPITAVVNFGQAAPAVGLIVVFAFWLGFGEAAAIAALVVYAVLPVLRNTMAGLDAVDRSLVEAGRGMGMSSLAVLGRIELPLAVPLILAGVRTALVLVVGTATLGVFVNAGGLGLLITTGVNLSLPRVLITGSILVAILALAVDWIGRVVEHVARPRGL